jgi:hypothetical protein
MVAMQQSAIAIPKVILLSSYVVMARTYFVYARKDVAVLSFSHSNLEFLLKLNSFDSFCLPRLLYFPVGFVGQVSLT